MLIQDDWTRSYAASAHKWFRLYIVPSFVSLFYTASRRANISKSGVLRYAERAVVFSTTIHVSPNVLEGCRRDMLLIASRSRNRIAEAREPRLYCVQEEAGME